MNNLFNFTSFKIQVKTYEAGNIQNIKNIS